MSPSRQYLDMYRSGLNCAEIARMAGVTRQAVNKTLREHLEKEYVQAEHRRSRRRLGRQSRAGVRA